MATPRRPSGGEILLPTFGGGEFSRLVVDCLPAPYFPATIVPASICRRVGKLAATAPSGRAASFRARSNALIARLPSWRGGLTPGDDPHRRIYLTSRTLELIYISERNDPARNLPRCRFSFDTGLAKPYHSSNVRTGIGRCWDRPPTALEPPKQQRPRDPPARSDPEFRPRPELFATPLASDLRQTIDPTVNPRHTVG